MTSKQRANLRSMAAGIEPIYQVGKDGLGDNLVSGLNEALEKRELVKITVLRSSDFSAKEVLDELCAALLAEPVCAIGNKVVLYRRSSVEGVKHIEF